MQRFYARAIKRDGGGQIVLQRDMGEEPQAQPAQDFRDLGVKPDLDLSFDIAIQRIDAALEGFKPEGSFGHDKGAGHFRAAATRHFFHPRHEDRSGQIDQPVGDGGGHDFALQPVLGQFGGKGLGCFFGEIGRQGGSEGGIVG